MINHQQQQQQRLQRRHSSLLELEAAEYFKLEPAQVYMLASTSTTLSSSKQPTEKPSSSSSSLSCKNKPTAEPQSPLVSTCMANAQHKHHKRQASVSIKNYHQQINQDHRVQADLNETIDANGQKRTTKVSSSPTTTTKIVLTTPSNLTCVSSSNSSSNSLPSISSSASVSPSLVCPHLTLDDILAQDPLGSSSNAGAAAAGAGAISPHTIGLCSECRLNAPPNIHSPLSPPFEPSTSSSFVREQKTSSEVSINRALINELDSAVIATSYKPNNTNHSFPMRRLHSDYQVTSTKKASKELTTRNNRLQLLQTRDDSLDYYLDPKEARRLQLSPTLRHSVEYIRNNFTEAGRVLRVHKNGQPFDKALRVCVTRGEFKNLNQLLDHINSRQLIPLGARYLFHLDGQLVYSVNELKHGSIYIVSGTRTFDFKANSMLKEQQRKQQLTHRAQHNQSQLKRQSQNRIRSHSSLAPLASAQSWSKLDQEEKDLMSKKKNAFQVELNPVRTDAILHKTPARQLTSSKITPKSSGQVDEKVFSQHSASQESLMTKNQSKQSVVAQKTEQQDEKQHEQMTKEPLMSASKSEENLKLNAAADDDDEKQEKVVNHVKPPDRPNLVRAKSEFDGSTSNRRKKNVTFVDTGRGSSPAIPISVDLQTENLAKREKLTPPAENNENNEKKQQVKTTDRQTEKGDNNIDALNKNEIGIQVSDSLSGFLIDLPLPVPLNKKEPLEDEKSNKKRNYLRKGEGSVNRQRARQPMSLNTGRTGSVATTRANSVEKKPKVRQIVTITERQLSLDEMNKLKDLDHGDHHSEKHPTSVDVSDNASKVQVVTIKLDHVDEQVVADTSRTGGGGDESKATDKNEKKKDAEEKVELKKIQTNDDELWEYPGGRESHATPTERPISQSDANESIHARVTTPSPTISSGDGGGGESSNNTSLSHSEIDGSSSITHEQEQKNISQQPEQVVAVMQAAKKCLPVVKGRLCDGFGKPESNFRLTWVNGFTINNEYPENSNTVAAQMLTDGRASSTNPSHLSPSSSNLQQQQQQQQSFKPNERFHNWISYSRTHDELIYPSGTLIVLWCRQTNEQRFYARHTSNVTALALCSPNSDLTASSQFGSDDSTDRLSLVHLWSLSKLELLQVIDDDQFKGRRIFSMKVNVSSANHNVCHVSLAARDERRIWLYKVSVKIGDSLAKESGTKKDDGQAIGVKSNKTPSNNNNNSSISTVIKVNKALQANQIPLLLTTLKEKQQQQQQEQALDVMLSFGRRHFQIYSVDQQMKLKPLKANEKSQLFIEIIVNATCLSHVDEKSEIIVGDNEGNITLLNLDFCSAQLQSSPSKTTTNTNTNNQTLNYNINTVTLYGISNRMQEKNVLLNVPIKQPAITCLVHISRSLFASADSESVIKFWRLHRLATTDKNQIDWSCRQVSSVSLPPDLGYICAIIISKYNRKQALVEFYVVTASNAILFGQMRFGDQQNACTWSLSVVYEGHESSVSNLVADCVSKEELKKSQSATRQQVVEHTDYFTCSLDCKICKWNDKNLIWKSMLPSACSSMALHPTGFVLAVGSADGTVYILDKVSGLLISYFPLTPVCINCLSYSRDGLLLAAGCSNGSIFILPVYERGLKYKKVSIFQSPYPVISLQFSKDSCYLLTSVTHASYQELILWDLPNFRYMRDNVKLAADKIAWFNAICSSSEDVRAIWENANLSLATTSATGGGSNETALLPTNSRQQMQSKRLSTTSTNSFTDSTTTVVNLSCDRLVKSNDDKDQTKGNFVIASDMRGYLRLFKYPAYDIQQAFYEIRVTSSPVNCCRFLMPKNKLAKESVKFVSTSSDGSICLWALVTDE